MSNAHEAAKAETMVDNDRVRVTKWSFAPGAATGFHTHEYDYVITPVIGSAVTVVAKDGEEMATEMVPGLSYFREAGVSHDVINSGAGELVFVETELKEPKR
ncbi:MAG: cupin domain-containing protein [Pikeienuella sp.]